MLAFLNVKSGTVASPPTLSLNQGQITVLRPLQWAGHAPLPQDGVRVPATLRPFAAPLPNVPAWNPWSGKPNEPTTCLG